MLAVLGRSWDYVGYLGPLLGPLLAVLEPMLAVLGRSWDLCWRSWAGLGADVGGLGPKKCEEHGYLENVLISRAGARSGAWGAVLRRSWGLCWRSWVALGPSVGGLGPLLEPTLAILGRSWNLCWRSWDVLGPKRSVLGRSGRSWEGIRAEKWPKPEPEGRSGGGDPERMFSVPGTSCRLDIYAYT